MNSTDPSEETPFAAVSKQTSKLGRVCVPLLALCRHRVLNKLCRAVLPILPRQSHPLHRIPLDQHRHAPRPLSPSYRTRPRLVYQSVFSSPSALKLSIYTDFSQVCYSLGIYLLNLFLAFLQPKFDPSLTQDEGLEDGDATLPTKQDEEFRPFIRRLPEFKFWHSATRAILLCFVCTWFQVFNLPVFWPVLVIYFLILFSVTSKSPSPNPPAITIPSRPRQRKTTNCNPQ